MFIISGGFSHGSKGSLEPPFWAGPSTKQLLMIGKVEPPSLATELKKLFLWLTLACF